MQPDSVKMRKLNLKVIDSKCNGTYFIHLHTIENNFNINTILKVKVSSLAMQGKRKSCWCRTRFCFSYVCYLVNNRNFFYIFLITATTFLIMAIAMIRSLSNKNQSLFIKSFVRSDYVIFQIPWFNIQLFPMIKDCMF